MSTIPDPELTKRINDSLDKACRHKRKLMSTNSRCTMTNIVLSAFATFLAALALSQDKWKVLCAVAAGVAFGAAIVSGLQTQLAGPELIGEASDCCARLRRLQMETTAPRCDWDKIRTEYGQIVFDCQRVNC